GSNHPLERPRREDEMTEEEKARMRRPKPGRPPRQRVGRIQILAVRREKLGAISLADAQSEGFADIAEFVAYWLALHDAAWLRTERTDDEKAERWATRWHDLDVWVISFAVIASVLLLAETPTSTGDYVDAEFNERGRRIAMKGEGEAVHPLIIDSWAD